MATTRSSSSSLRNPHRRKKNSVTPSTRSSRSSATPLYAAARKCCKREIATKGTKRYKRFFVPFVAKLLLYEYAVSRNPAALPTGRHQTTPGCIRYDRRHIRDG